jgi:hypothetical protein
MQLLDRVRSMFAKRATDPISFLPAYSQDFGPGLSAQPSHQALLRENRGIPNMATRAIANRVASLEPQVKVSRRVRDGTLVDEILDDHPLKALIDRPHPNITRWQFFRLATQYIVSVGEAYWLKVGSRLGVPVELHPIPPTNIWPLVSGGVVEAYGVRDGNGRRSTLDARDVVRFYFPDPESPFESEGYLGPSATTVDSLKFSGEHLRSHYQNDATPKTVLEAQEGAIGFTPEERDRFDSEYRLRYSARLGTKAGIPFITPLNYKLQQMALQSGADIKPLLEHWTDEELMNFGTPKSVLGKVVSGDRSSAEVNQYVFDRYTVLPIATLIADALTLQLAPDFDPALFVEFEEFVSEDKEFELRREAQDLTLMKRSINMVREDDGDDPVEWGDSPVATLGQVPYDATAYDLELDDEDALGEPVPVANAEDDEDRARAERARLQTSQSARARGREPFSARAAFFSKRAAWQREVMREKKYVPTFRKAMLSILTEQRKSVLAKLEELNPRARMSADDLFTPEEWVELFELRVEPVRERAFRVIMGETLTGLGLDGEFVFTDAMRDTLRKQGAQLVKNANRTTKHRIAQQLEIATVEGEGIDQIAKRIRHVFGVRRKQSRTIARTEVLKASQEAQLTGFETSGVVEGNTWNTSMDDAVRDEHTYAEGQQRGLRAGFNLIYELADAPGIGHAGASLSAGNSINCRCFLTPVTIDES